MSVLELRSISKVYGKGAAEVQALRDVSLRVASGEMVAVMGPSGSGKSSLLTIAGTLEEPTAGAVLIKGKDVHAMSGGAKARVRRQTIGYVFQDFNLLPGLTAVENVSLPLELDGTSMRRAHLAGLAALETLGLGDRARAFPDQRAVLGRVERRRHHPGKRHRLVPAARRHPPQPVLGDADHRRDPRDRDRRHRRRLARPGCQQGAHRCRDLRQDPAAAADLQVHQARPDLGRGLIWGAAGLFALYASGGWNGGQAGGVRLLVPAGLIACVISCALLAPFFVDVLSRLAARAPLATRPSTSPASSPPRPSWPPPVSRRTPSPRSCTRLPRSSSTWQRHDDLRQRAADRHSTARHRHAAGRRRRRLAPRRPRAVRQPGIGAVRPGHAAKIPASRPSRRYRVIS